MGRRLAQISLGASLGLLVALGVVLLGRSGERGSHPHLLPAPFSVRSTTLTATSGEARMLPGDHDGPQVVFFGYTNCPDVCPLTMARLARVVEALEAEGEPPPRVVFVSVDPERDTPERIATWLGRFDEDFVGLTGSRDELEETLSAWGVYASDPADPPSRPAGDPEPVLIDHTGRSFLVDRRGRVVGTFPGDTSADAILATLREVAGP